MTKMVTMQSIKPSRAAPRRKNAQKESEEVQRVAVPDVKVRPNLFLTFSEPVYQVEPTPVDAQNVISVLQAKRDFIFESSVKNTFPSNMSTPQPSATPKPFITDFFEEQNNDEQPSEAPVGPSSDGPAEDVSFQPPHYGIARHQNSISTIDPCNENEKFTCQPFSKSNLESTQILSQPIASCPLIPAQNPSQATSYFSCEEEMPEMLQPNARKRLGKSNRTHYFKPLIFLLKSYFLGEGIPPVLPTLHPFDYQIAITILKRKYALKPANYSSSDKAEKQNESQTGGKGEKSANSQIGGKSEKLINLQGPIEKSKLSETYAWLVSEYSGNSHKRVEENTKFIFKHTLKRLKTDFFESQGAGNGSAATEEAFYDHYFGVIKGKLPLEAFFDPLNQKQRRPVNSPKTLSLNYIELVFSSPSFRANFERYIGHPNPEESEFLSEYSSTVNSKLQKTFYAWEKRFDKANCASEAGREMLDYFEKNHQCKLPWTKAEVLAAVRVFLELINQTVEAKQGHTER